MSRYAGASKTVTARYTGVDTNGKDLSFTCPITEFMIIVESGTGVYTGTMTGSNVGGIHFTGSLSVPIGGPSNHSLGNIAAASGTVDVSIIAWR